MLRIPENFVHSRSTPFWNKDTAPKALFTHHNTKAHVYGRLSVMQGAVRYFDSLTVMPPNQMSNWLLKPVVLVFPHHKNGIASNC